PAGQPARPRRAPELLTAGLPRAAGAVRVGGPDLRGAVAVRLPRLGAQAALRARWAADGAVLRGRQPADRYRRRGPAAGAAGLRDRARRPVLALPRRGRRRGALRRPGGAWSSFHR